MEVERKSGVKNYWFDFIKIQLVRSKRNKFFNANLIFIKFWIEKMSETWNKAKKKENWEKS